MEIRRFAAPLGAEVFGVDVRALSESDWAEIHEAFLEHHVLAFPEQTLEPDDQVAFAQRWGELIPFPYAALEGYPNIIELKNRGKKKDVNQHWHSDMTYNPVPPKLTMLYALEAPALGGETAFSNQHLAYEHLSDGLKAVLGDAQAFHTAEGLAKLYGENVKEAPRATHPVFRRHDETGELGLYVCRAFTRRFIDWTREESKPMLEYLFEVSVRPEFQARHQWKKGDLVMWDNRSVLHYAVHDHGDDPRVIHPCQVRGVKPI